MADTTLRTLLEMEASLLDSDVQELLGREELAGYELTSNPQLQWATQTEFPSVVRLFGVNCCCASSLPSSAVEEQDLCDVGDSGCFAKVKQPSAARGSHSAWSRCRHQSHPSPCQANLRCPIKNRCASPPTPRTCRNTCKVGYSSGPAQNLTLIGGRVRSGYVRVNDGNEIHQGSQRRRIRRERAPATGRPCPGAAHSTHPSLIPWSYHCSARDESAGRSVDSSWGIWERHAEEYPLHHCGHFRTLRRVIVVDAGALDEGRIGGFERQRAMLCQIYGYSSLQRRTVATT